LAFQITAGGSYLGVHVKEITAERAKELKIQDEHGVEITVVQEDSPAEKAGLKKSDVVLEYNGQRVEGTEQFIRLVRETPAGRQVRLQLSRAGSVQTITATIGRRDLAKMLKGARGWVSSGDWSSWRNWQLPDMPHPFMGVRSQMLGIDAESVDDQLAAYFGVKKGVLVRAVRKNTVAEKAGLKAGDVITKIGQREVDSPNDIASAMRSRGESKAVAATVVRDRKDMQLTFSFDEPAESERVPGPARRIMRREAGSERTPGPARSITRREEVRF
jgi:serine protease Do